MTFDSEEELRKIHSIFPEADLVLRLNTEATDAMYNLNEKFGASIPDAENLIKLCKEFNMKIKGISFHVGTGGVTYRSYHDSLSNARNLFNFAKNIELPDLEILDIGGGFT